MKSSGGAFAMRYARHDPLSHQPDAVYNWPLVRALCQRDPVLGYDLTSRFLQVMGDRLQSARRRLQDCQRAAGHHNDL